jgi:Secretion system C-terminal sorting domain
MKKNLLLVLFGLFFNSQSFSQTQDTVSIGPGYSNQTWYNLATKQTYSQPLANWDLAFEITGFNASILINSAIGLELYAIPNLEASEQNFLSLDTIGINSWQKLYNSDTSWNSGAFNQNLSSNPFDVGWGIYNMNTHIITGDSLYIMKLADGTFKKLWIINLASGTYNFRYANLDGSDDTQASISKSNFTGKNFGYYSLLTKSSIDREPASKDFSLVFSKYTSFIPIPYSVTGVLMNKGYKAIKAQGVDINTVEPNSYSYSSLINTIGYDWKRFDFSLGWVLEDSLVYFVKADSINIYKIVFTEFGGSTNGNFVFSSEKIVSSGIHNKSGNLIGSISIYPNPSNAINTTLILDLNEKISKLKVSLLSLNGQLIESIDLATNIGFNQIQLPTSSLSSGTYLVKIETQHSVEIKKLIISK